MESERDCVKGSRRERRRRRARRGLCSCWLCLPSKAKKNDEPRVTRERKALRDQTAA